MEVTLSEIKDLLFASCVNAPASVSDAGEKRQIVICERGWVFVGMVSRTPDGLLVRNGSVVRRWGTTNGIGELASSGPLKETKLDSCPSITLPSWIARIDCVESKWPR